MDIMSLEKVKVAAAHLERRINAPHGSMSIRSSFHRGVEDPFFVVTIFPGNEALVKNKPSKVDGIDVVYSVQAPPMAYTSI